MKRYIVVAILILATLTGTAADATTWTVQSTRYISSCSNLNESGATYELAADIVNSSTPHCINITASDITLDCQGHRIDGTDAEFIYFGIYVHGTTKITNVTVKNCVLSDWQQANICLDNTDRNTLENITSTSGPDSGILLRASDNNTLTNITASGNLDGIHLYYFSDSNILTNITSTNNLRGFRIQHFAESNIINNSRIEENGQYGVLIFDAGANKMYNNLFNNADNVHFSMTTYRNYWNTIRQSGERVYSGGTEIGGNYWTDPSGNGYSDTCIDSDRDGFCDDIYSLNSQNIDYLPLSDEYSGGNSDLVATDAWVGWQDNCTICYNITNIGTEKTPAYHNTTLYVDGVKAVYDCVDVALEPNEIYIGCFDGYNWRYTPTEDTITVCVDDNNTVEESNETNNYLTDVWLCGDPGGDMMVDTADLQLLLVHLFARAQINKWAGDVDGSGYINILDARLLMNNITNPTGYPLNCTCEEV